MTCIVIGFWQGRQDERKISNEICPQAALDKRQALSFLKNLGCGVRCCRTQRRPSPSLQLDGAAVLGHLGLPVQLVRDALSQLV